MPHVIAHSYDVSEQPSVAPFRLERLGTIMEPEPGNPLEVEGVLNPGGIRGPDGQFYLFPRLVGRGNYSRIGIAQVLFSDTGDPVGVKRLGVVLEPTAEYELRPGGGGCEDPRLSFVENLQRYVMTYTALGPQGPRIALAISDDLFHWQRVGLASFHPYGTLDFNGIDNKDALIFPTAIPDPTGKPAMAMVHRPLFPGTHPHQTAEAPPRRPVDLHRESIWISYCPSAIESGQPHCLCDFSSHHRLASPVAPWERLKIGAGTPPVLTQHGWLLFYHGVHEITDAHAAKRRLCYSAGVMVLSPAHPRFIRYRSAEPVLAPELPVEREGIVPGVVFPTAIDHRTDAGLPNRFDVYYGMADSRIGVASLHLPEHLPPGACADQAEAKV